MKFTSSAILYKKRTYVEESTLKVLRKPIYNEFGDITIDDARIDETCKSFLSGKT